VFPYPLTCTCLQVWGAGGRGGRGEGRGARAAAADALSPLLSQFGVGSLLALVMWGVGAHPKPKMDKALVGEGGGGRGGGGGREGVCRAEHGPLARAHPPRPPRSRP